MTEPTIAIVLNGRVVEIPKTAEITYETLCELEGLNPDHNPSAIFSVPNGPDGILRPGRPIALVENTIFNIMHTSNA